MDDDGDSDEKESGKEGESGGKTNKTAEAAVFLPEEGAAEKEHSNSMAIFFVLLVIIFCIFLVHFILQVKCHYLPESVAVVFLGRIKLILQYYGNF